MLLTNYLFLVCWNTSTLNIFVLFSFFSCYFFFSFFFFYFFYQTHYIREKDLLLLVGFHFGNLRFYLFLGRLLVHNIALLLLLFLNKCQFSFLCFFFSFSVIFTKINNTYIPRHILTTRIFTRRTFSGSISGHHKVTI